MCKITNLAVVSSHILVGPDKFSYYQIRVTVVWSLRLRFLAGLPRARSARGREPHTHRIWSTSFLLVVTWLTERTYASTDCTGRVGETIKRKGGVSQACLGKSTSFTLAIHNMVNWQLSKQDSHCPVSHWRIEGSCVNSSRWLDLFGSCPLTSCLTRSRSMFNLILSS